MGRKTSTGLAPDSCDTTRSPRGGSDASLQASEAEPPRPKVRSDRGEPPPIGSDARSTWLIAEMRRRRRGRPRAFQGSQLGYLLYFIHKRNRVGQTVATLEVAAKHFKQPYGTVRRLYYKHRSVIAGFKAFDALMLDVQPTRNFFKAYPQIADILCNDRMALLFDAEVYRMIQLYQRSPIGSRERIEAAISRISREIAALPSALGNEQ